MRALSIRQPWATLIVSGGKDVENRSWATPYRGPLLIHASLGMTRAEYFDAANLCREIGIAPPPAHSLQRGGIIGQAEIVACVTDFASPWFFGRFGLVLANARPIPFRPYKGQLGFFEVSLADTL